MAERRPAFVERIIHRIEDRVEEWRRQDTAHKAEADRKRLWSVSTKVLRAAKGPVLIHPPLHEAGESAEHVPL